MSANVTPALPGPQHALEHAASPQLPAHYGGYDAAPPPAEPDGGLQIARVVPVNLIIVDVNMPGMDGLSFVKEIRGDTRPHVRDLAVILLTGEKAEDIKARGLEAGANGFLHKPVSAAQLSELVNQFVPNTAA